MKKTNLPFLAISLGVVLLAANVRAVETNVVQRIGIYDSRAVAFAWFGSSEHQKQLNQMVKDARAAQAGSDTNRFAQLKAALQAAQDEIHREGFSTAPPDDALAQIKDRLPEIQQAAGVTALISEWDDAALKQFPNAGQVDVTGQLVNEFKPTEKQLKTISELEKSKPLPLDQCNELIRQGGI